MTDKVRRRLTTLLCADVAGYARLMGVGEAGTLATRCRRSAAMATRIERHEGRVVNIWGEAVIAFARVVEAASCRRWREAIKRRVARGPMRRGASLE